MTAYTVHEEDNGTFHITHIFCPLATTGLGSYKNLSHSEFLGECSAVEEIQINKKAMCCSP